MSQQERSTPSGDKKLATNFMQGMQAGQMLGSSLNDLAQQSSLNRIAAQVAQAGGDITALDPAQFTSPRDMMALGQYQEQYVRTQEGRQQVFQAYGAWAKAQHEIVRQGAAWLDNVQDSHAWGRGVEQIAARLGLPFALEYDPRSTSFVLVEEDEEGHRKPAGERVSMQEVRHMLDQWREKPELVARFVMPHALGAMERNMASKQDPSTWRKGGDGSGRTLTLVPQTQPGAQGGLEHGYIVMGEGQGARFLSSRALAQAGIRLEPRAAGPASPLTQGLRGIVEQHGGRTADVGASWNPEQGAGQRGAPGLGQGAGPAWNPHHAYAQGTLVANSGGGEGLEAGAKPQEEGNTPQIHKQPLPSFAAGQPNRDRRTRSSKERYIIDPDDIKEIFTLRGVNNVDPQAARRVTGYTGLINKYAQQYTLPPALIMAVIHVESKGIANNTSPRGARGLMQLTKEAIEQIHGPQRGNLSPFYEEDLNLQTGTAYLRWLYDKPLLAMDDRLAIAAYNRGGGHILKRDGILKTRLNALALAQDEATAERVARILAITDPPGEDQNWLDALRRDLFLALPQEEQDALVEEIIQSSPKSDERRYPGRVMEQWPRYETLLERAEQ